MSAEAATLPGYSRLPASLKPLLMLSQMKSTDCAVDTIGLSGIRGVRSSTVFVLSPYQAKKKMLLNNDAIRNFDTFDIDCMDGIIPEMTSMNKHFGHFSMKYTITV